MYAVQFISKELSSPVRQPLSLLVKEVFWLDIEVGIVRVPSNLNYAGYLNKPLRPIGVGGHPDLTCNALKQKLSRLMQAQHT